MRVSSPLFSLSLSLPSRPSVSPLFLLCVRARLYTENVSTFPSLYRAATLAFVDSVKCSWVYPGPPMPADLQLSRYISVRARLVTRACEYQLLALKIAFFGHACYLNTISVALIDFTQEIIRGIIIIILIFTRKVKIWMRDDYVFADQYIYNK